MKYLAVLPLVALLAACSEGVAGGRDYDSSAACNARGYKAGTPEFESCYTEEHKGRMLDAQRREYEQRKADDEYWRTQRGHY